MFTNVHDEEEKTEENLEEKTVTDNRLLELSLAGAWCLAILWLILLLILIRFVLRESTLQKKTLSDVCAPSPWLRRCRVEREEMGKEGRRETKTQPASSSAGPGFQTSTWVSEPGLQAERRAQPVPWLPFIFWLTIMRRRGLLKIQGSQGHLNFSCARAKTNHKHSGQPSMGVRITGGKEWKIWDKLKQTNIQAGWKWQRTGVEMKAEVTGEMGRGGRLNLAFLVDMGKLVLVAVGRLDLVDSGIVGVQLVVRQGSLRSCKKLKRGFVS